MNKLPKFPFQVCFFLSSKFISSVIFHSCLVSFIFLSVLECTNRKCFLAPVHHLAKCLTKTEAEVSEVSAGVNELTSVSALQDDLDKTQ